MKNKQIFYWIIDIIILGALVLEYELDWTGLQIHELLGLAVFGVMLVHLIAHWRWVVSVTEKIFDSASGKAAFCYVINAILLFSFTGIIVTGLIISSLLSLPLQTHSYDFWRFLHVTGSYLTLVVVGLKLAIHWNWIVNTTKRKIFKSRKSAPAMAVDSNSVCMSRRHFLAQTGLVSGAMLVAGVSYVDWMRKYLFVDENTVQASSGNPEIATAEPQIIYVTATAEQQLENAANSAAADENSAVIKQPLEITTAIPTATATAIPTTAPTSIRPAAASSSNTTAVRCNRGCSYPGHCRRYEDTNGNNICDLSEW